VHDEILSFDGERRGPGRVARSKRSGKSARNKGIGSDATRSECARRPAEASSPTRSTRCRSPQRCESAVGQVRDAAIDETRRRLDRQSRRQQYRAGADDQPAAHR
jgi:hypothetical protein